jgi:hypothetical protein
MARLAAIRKQREATKIAKEKEATGAFEVLLVSCRYTDSSSSSSQTRNQREQLHLRSLEGKLRNRDLTFFCIFRMNSGAEYPLFTLDRS